MEAASHTSDHAGEGKENISQARVHVDVCFACVLRVFLLCMCAVGLLVIKRRSCVYICDQITDGTVYAGGID